MAKIIPFKSMDQLIGEKILAADKISHDYLFSLTEADLRRLSMIGRAAYERELKEREKERRDRDRDRGE